MLKQRIDFEKIYEHIPLWKWSELAFGLKKSLLSVEEIKAYALFILTEETEQFDTVLKICIATEEEKVEDNLDILVRKEKLDDFEIINSKWIFAIIYNAYLSSEEVFDVIEDVYVEFDYPEEIKCLISYCTIVKGVDTFFKEKYLRTVA